MKNRAFMLKSQFIRDVQNLDGEPQVLITVTKLPSGALETQVNYHNLGEKITYIIGNYDADFRLNANHNVRIVGYILQ